MKNRGPISLADLVRALRRLDIDPADVDSAARVAVALGADWSDAAQSEKTASATTAPVDSSKDLGTPRAGKEPGGSEAPPRHPIESRWSGSPPVNRRRLLRPVKSTPREIPERLLRAPVFAKPDLDEKRPVLPLDPLFRPNWSRHILTGTLSVRRPEGPLDLREATRKIGRGECFEQVPRLPWPSLKRRVHLLVDCGPGMEPFRRDQQMLAAQFRRVIGDSRLKALNFRGCPSRAAGSGPDFTWRPYPRPEAGTAVVLFSDLGAAPLPVRGEAADTQEWIAFARDLVEGHCPVVCFSPYLRREIPARLLRWVTLIPWDRETSVGRIRRILSGGLPVTPNRR